MKRMIMVLPDNQFRSKAARTHGIYLPPDAFHILPVSPRGHLSIFLGGTLIALALELCSDFLKSWVELVLRIREKCLPP
jgi:hypothetical protein